MFGNIRYHLFYLRNRLQAERRVFYSIFNYKKLAQPILPSQNFYPAYDFNFYGIGHVLKSKFDLKGSGVEHGFVFGSYVQEHLISGDTENIIYTFSDYREKMIKNKKHQIQVRKVGPYIAYAKDIFSKKYYNNLKSKLGRVLLVFPEHTLMDIDVNFQRDEFVRIIEEKAKEFDNVIICGYWADILKGNLDYYENKGFMIVCAGHNLDRYFLSRLKFILSLSDTILTNSIGTHIGYSMYFGKHTIVFKQEISSYLLNKNSNELSARSKEDNYTLFNIKEKIYKTFECSLNDKSNNREQRMLISEMFGFQYVGK